nr:mobilization protein [Pantoea stewartii]
MLKGAFSEHEKSVRAELKAKAKRKRISAAGPQARPEAVLSHERARESDVLRMVSRIVADHRHWCPALPDRFRSAAISVVHRVSRYSTNYTTIREQKSTQAMLSERNSGVQLSTCGDQRRRCVRAEPGSGRVRERTELDDTGGETAP